MSEASSSTTGNSAPTTGTGTTAELLVRAPIKRARPQLSCTPCRQGKLKCNREHPVCDQCAKRSRQEVCQYVPPPPRNKQAQNMRGRIRNLESLVVNLINQKQQEDGASTPAAPSIEPTATKEVEELSLETFGQMRISSQGNDHYVGAGHWSALLKEIEEVKNGINDDEEEEDQGEEWDDDAARSTVTFGMPRHITKTQLIQEMPSKEECDRLLPLWFNSADPLLFIMHVPTFQEEYNQFWIDASSTSVMWIALLYSAMALGIILGPRNPGMNAHAAAYDNSSGSIYNSTDSSGTNDYLNSAVNRFQQLASSAIVLADVTKSQPYTLETLMIYSECEFLRRDDHHSKIWLMNGVSMRVAMRMGYHRDPSNFKGMSPFQGEMRRRVWHVLNMLDTLISFAIGLPAVVRRIESDTRAPQNLYDLDLSPNMTKMPKARPSSELTPATYTIAKAKICAVFAEAAELAQRITPPRYAIVVSLEKRLEEAHDQVPEGMRVRPVQDCVTDAPVLIMGRYNIELLYLKTKLVLHRAFLTAGQTDPKYAESRKICVDSALEILRYHVTIFHACQPGGQLNKVWWYMSSLQTFDFLLAAMVICLELNHLQSTGDSSSGKISDMFSLLQSTYDIWANHPNRFRDSVRGAEILKAMLKKCSSPGRSGLSPQDPAPSGFEKNTSDLPKEMTPESLPEELPPQIWNNWPSADNMTFDVPDIASEIDWNLWDSTMMGQDHMLPPTNWVNSNNTTMESWMGATSNVDSMIAQGLEGFTDLRDPLNIYGPSAFNPAPPPPSSTNTS
ncbi:uncharacterized protein CC84DRAFT_620271 [Paraphaeosphaeria sporulosa]|uniref:Zn(2)-C6 fungal-type domain-containing protein n=1 Tax=Paraphaeosphaeria sporulosa TaxID=1460663 RepID=A0A177CGP0_9PLEO|nr:uncharacterized protein CC84DRAFT_620271 [Paraphaeosphaeria sporulosa]OAG06745.1 hypothetical protein CC84DRAFT_620271 [Paraphaeosphaeria sporulosa]